MPAPTTAAPPDALLPPSEEWTKEDAQVFLWATRPLATDEEFEKLWAEYVQLRKWITQYTHPNAVREP